MGDGAERRSVRRRPASPRAVLAVVGFAVFVAADDLTVVATMLRPIIGDLGLVLPDGLDEAAWIVNAYLIAFVAVMPIAGRLSDIVGRRRTFLAAYSLFIVGTIIIPTASSLGPFLFGRVLTAIGGGAMVPVALAVVGDVYPNRPRALGILGRSRRSAGCGVRCTARCWCGSFRGNGSSGSTFRSPSSGWSPHGLCWLITTGRSARHESTGSVACSSRSSWSR